MTYAQRLRKLADSTGLDAFGDEIRAIADEMDAQPADVTDEQIDTVIRRHWGDSAIPTESVRQFARAILALRPERVPMTDEALWTSVIEHLGPEALSGGRMSILDAFHLGITVAEAHHGITAQAKKEGA